ncbi:MAG: alcohol dehydrogenase catalytic domain-containing protein [Actinomycetota bacterium]
MRAVRARGYGTPDALTLEEVERPTRDGDQVLVEVRAAALNPADWHRMEGEIPTLRQAYGDPKPTDPALGTDCAGTVVAVGNDLTRFTNHEQLVSDQRVLIIGASGGDTPCLGLVVAAGPHPMGPHHRDPRTRRRTRPSGP